MKSTILLCLIMLLNGLTAGAQDQAEHHPTRILIMFETDSPVFQEIRSEYAKSAQEADEKLKSGDATGMSLTKTFLDVYNLVSFEKLVSVSEKLKNTGSGVSLRNRARDRMFIVEVDDPADLKKTIEKLRNNPEVKIAEPDFKQSGSGKMVDVNTSGGFTNDPFYTLQWGLENTGQSINEIPGVAGEDINIKKVWDEFTTGNSDIVMAVLDTGFPDNVTEMGNRVLPGYNFVSDNGITTDDHGHGTSTASIALATGNNGLAMAGIDWEAKLLPVKILDENNEGFNSWAAQGVYWAIEQGVDVINYSVGTSSNSSILRQAFEDALADNIHVAACMMNYNNEVTYYPAGYEGIIAVGAINNKGERAVPFSWGGGSNYGAHIDLVAPGDLIVSLNSSDPDGAVYWSGTSQATPMVAGVISLMLSVNPDLTPDESLQFLVESARGDGSWNKYTGWGVLDGYEAVSMAYTDYTSAEENEDSGLPVSTILNQNYPNPFNPTTNISFELAEASRVSLKVYNTVGQEVASILEESGLSRGTHTVTFDASGLTSGLYLYRLEAGGFLQTHKMILMK